MGLLIFYYILKAFRPLLLNATFISFVFFHLFTSILTCTEWPWTEQSTTNRASLLRLKFFSTITNTNLHISYNIYPIVKTLRINNKSTTNHYFSNYSYPVKLKTSNYTYIYSNKINLKLIINRVENHSLKIHPVTLRMMLATKCSLLLLLLLFDDWRRTEEQKWRSKKEVKKIFF